MLAILFSIGCSYTFSVLTVYFRDLQWLLQMGMQTLFFLTPILFKSESLNNNAKFIVELNPLTPIIKLFSEILNYQDVSFDTWILSTAIALLVFFIGCSIFVINRNKIIFRL
jgi:ABC-type polysaccharide/polyol phosphate export permease